MIALHEWFIYEHHDTETRQEHRLAQAARAARVKDSSWRSYMGGLQPLNTEQQRAPRDAHTSRVWMQGLNIKAADGDAASDIGNDPDWERF